MPQRSSDPDRDSLSPETRREIERHLDSTVSRTGLLATAGLRYAKQALWVIPVLLVLAYAADYIQLRSSQNPTSTVSIKRYYAVGLKNGKTEMYYAEPENEACVNAIFPHLGYSPCWYLRRHNMKEISI
jgi:hypothetical protein